MVYMQFLEITISVLYCFSEIFWDYYYNIPAHFINLLVVHCVFTLRRRVQFIINLVPPCSPQPISCFHLSLHILVYHANTTTTTNENVRGKILFKTVLVRTLSMQHLIINSTATALNSDCQILIDPKMFRGKGNAPYIYCKRIQRRGGNKVEENIWKSPGARCLRSEA